MYQKLIKNIYQKKLFSNEIILNENDNQLNYILKFLHNYDKKSYILDAGCGNGKYSFYLANLGFKNIFAIDLLNGINTNKFSYVQSSIDCLPFKDDSFDFIFSLSVIYYINNPEDVIREFKRVLKKDGILIITSHTKYSIFTLWRILQRDILNLKKMEHLKFAKFYSTNYYAKLIKRNGFEILLQDGFNLSFIIYPLYKKFAKFLEKYINLKLPKKRPYISSGIIGTIKSEIAYHSILVTKNSYK